MFLGLFLPPKSLFKSFQNGAHLVKNGLFLSPPAGKVRTCADGDPLKATAVQSPPPLRLNAAQMFSLGQENISTSPTSTKGPVKYGELIVLG